MLTEEEKTEMRRITLIHIDRLRLDENSDTEIAQWMEEYIAQKWTIGYKARRELMISIGL